MSTSNLSSAHTPQLEIMLLTLLNRKFPMRTGYHYNHERLEEMKTAYWRSLSDIDPHEAQAFKQWTASKKKEVAIARLKLAEDSLARAVSAISLPAQTELDFVRRDLLCYMAVAGDIPQNYHLEEQDVESLRDHLFNYTERDDLTITNLMPHIDRRSMGMMAFAFIVHILHTATMLVEASSFQ